MTSAAPERNRTITQQDREDAARLKAIYDRKKKQLGLTQEKLAGLMGFATQASISHFMNAKAAMNNEHVIKFAAFLKVDPTEIRPDIFDRVPLSESGTGLDQDALTFARRYARLSAEERAIFDQLMERLDRPTR